MTVPAKPQRPKHVAMIMDGNGRWAKDRGLPRLAGHRKGADVVRDITTFCRELEIPYLTLYSFSTENWRRPVDEISGLMQLLEEYCAQEEQTLMKHDIRLQLIGNGQRLPLSTQKSLQRLQQSTQNNQAMVLTLAIDYGAREELTRAIQRLLLAHKESPDLVNEQNIVDYLDTAGLPDPDLFIRTSGEQRLSNFLLWQMAYTELCFTPVRWPDFSRQDFVACLNDFAQRERRFGATSEQVET